MEEESEWNEVGKKIPEAKRSIEVVGYFTTCCQLDADREISIRKCFYNDSCEIYDVPDGPEYCILPFFWRYLD